MIRQSRINFSKMFISAFVLGFLGYFASAPLVVAGDGRTEAVKPSANHVAAKVFDELWSGYKYATLPTQVMQDDEFENPGMAWHDIGEAEWSKKDGELNKSCADCHKDASALKGVGATYPVYFEPWKKMINIEQRINLCREKNMKAKPYKYESDQMMGMTIFIKRQSLGMPMSVKVDGKAAPFFEAGKKFYYERRGQMDMSCAHCHEKYFGQKIRMNTLSQGQSNGFPTYRLKWQKPGTLHRRFKGCNDQVRATPFKRGSDEYVNLELYLSARGNGLEVETPAVRN